MHQFNYEDNLVTKCVNDKTEILKFQTQRSYRAASNIEMCLFISFISFKS